jgi:uncharacterized repeat protein (TIGR03803 family)
MMTNHIVFAHLCSASPRKVALALGVASSMLGLGLSASAQESAPVPNAKQFALHKFANPPYALHPAEGAMRLSAIARESALASNAKEIVVHNFASPLHGAYPAWGVISDSAGNLYGTTDGAYSDVGGGGTNNAGVVFKVDPAGHETVLYSFKGGADGNSPNSLILDSAGNLYGTTTNGGGASSAGVVFKLDTTGHETVLYSFTGGADGGNPYGGVVRDSAGNLYGVTGSGGTGTGVVFKVDPTGHERVLYAFTGGADGAYPNPVILSGGNLYGTTTNGGGASGAGVVFKVDMSGNETVLYSFMGANDGAYSSAGVIRDSTGNLYGTTSAGGASNAGVVFKVDASGHETVLYSFTGEADGASPLAGVIRDPAGNFYGTTAFGGTAALGVVFKVDTSGNETVLHTFMRGPYGNQPDTAGVIRDSEGNLFGTTAFNGAGGQGAVYKLDTNGNPTVLYAFPGAADGQHPYNGGLIFAWDGQLYGTGSYGGKSGAGVLYQLDGRGNEQVLYSFASNTAEGFGQPTGTVLRDWGGNFYGTTFIGQADTGYGYGVVYKVDTAGHAKVLHNFTNGADGGNPYGGVISDWEGNLYGTAVGGGASGAGVVFKIDKSGNESVLYSFTGGADGAHPYGELVRDWKGNLYGTTNGGGASSAGAVFKIDKSGNESVLYSFTGGSDGGYPLAGVILDSKGILYGTTNGGGASGAGVVFKVDTSGNETVLYSFTGGDDGGYPLWVVLARDGAGNLYGTTSGGGASGAGVVFKVDTSGNETVLHSFTGGDDGGNPYVGVIFGPEGNLYGTADSGGASSAGVVFEIKP